MNVKIARSVASVALGPETIVAIGAATSSQVRVAGVASALPAMSVARTLSVCTPGVWTVSVSGELHGSYGAPSSEHS